MVIIVRPLLLMPLAVSVAPLVPPLAVRFPALVGVVALMVLLVVATATPTIPVGPVLRRPGRGLLPAGVTKGQGNTFFHPHTQL